jgi:hypothetical protein
MKEGVWVPDEKNSEGDLQVDARPAFGQPIAIETSKQEMLRLISRLKADGREKQIHVSNQMFKKCIGKQFNEQDDVQQEEFEAFCGNVLVFYCTRFLLDGRGVPFLEPEKVEVEDAEKS